MSSGPWGVAPPSPTTESKFFNAARRTVTLLVEAGFDQRFWRIHCVRDCHIRATNGRFKAIEELDRAAPHDDAQLLAILDADFDRIEDTLDPRADVVWTDAHDLEGTLLTLGVLERILAQFVDPQKLTRLEGQWSQPTRERLYNHAEGMGRLRWLTRRKEEVTLVFKKPSKGELKHFDGYKDCTDANWAPSLAAAIRKLRDYSSAHHLPLDDLLADCEDLPPADRAQLCNGHDLMGFLHAWLKQVSNHTPRTVDDLANHLAIACDHAELRQTAMWRDIQAWEQAHPGFQVLQPRA